MASLTVPTMMSPMPAYRRPEPPRTRMHKISLAPVLSATRSRDSCWITSTPGCRAGSHLVSLAERIRPRRRPSLLSLFYDLDDAPPLRRRQRTGLHQEHPVADAAGVLLVVRLELVRAAHDLAVQAVLDAVLDLDHHRLVHLVADHEALADLTVVAHGLLAHVLFLAHAVTSSLVTAALMPSSRSRITV